MAAIKFNNYRGVKDLVIAPMTIESDGGTITESYGAVIPLSGVQGVSVSEDQGSEEVYYDNGARIAINYEGPAVVTLTVSVVDLETRAKIEGRTWDATKKAYIGTPAKKGYFALGYKAGIVGDDGDDAEEYRWFYKGKFTGGDTTHNTKANNTDSTNVTYTYTAIQPATEYQLTDGKHPAKYAIIPSTHSAAATFFDTVVTPDKIQVTG